MLITLVTLVNLITEITLVSGLPGQIGPVQGSDMPSTTWSSFNKSINALY